MSRFVVFQEKGITETNGSVFSAVFVTDFLGENDARDGYEKRRHPADQREFVGASMKTRVGKEVCSTLRRFTIFHT